MKSYTIPFFGGVLLVLSAAQYFQWNVPLAAQTRNANAGLADPLLQAE